MLPWRWNLPPNDRHYYPLYAERIELGIPFCLQVGHTGPLRPSEPGRPIPYLDEVALDLAGACLEQVDTLGLDDETKQLFLHDNAARVFGPCVTSNRG